MPTSVPDILAHLASARSPKVAGDQALTVNGVHVFLAHPCAGPATGN